jgi:hypothetical protein
MWRPVTRRPTAVTGTARSRRARDVASRDGRRDRSASATHGIVEVVVIAVIKVAIIKVAIIAVAPQRIRARAGPAPRRRIRRPAIDESKSGPVRIRRAVETGLPYGPTTRCVGASL